MDQNQNQQDYNYPQGPYSEQTTPQNLPVPQQEQWYQYPTQQTEGFQPPSTPPQQSDRGYAPEPAPEQPYRWDYNHFEGYSKAPKTRRNTGLIAFLVALIGSLLVGVVAIAVVSFWDAEPMSIVEPNVILEPDDQSGIGSQTGSSEEEPVEKPDDHLIKSSTGNVLTIPQIAKQVTPSVVGVLRYQNTYTEPTAIGSGIITDIKQGYAYIVTNAHVVENGTGFKIRLNDAQTYDARLIGADTKSDIAVLRIEAEDHMVAAEIGDSTKLQVGETVVAIGNPVSTELSGSVTDGIVSALGRKLSDDNAINYIQTNAAINPGNSGGALVNQYGQVIGINTMKVSGTGYEGIGFAIPMAEAIPIMEEIREFGSVSLRPVLGITGTIISEEDAADLEAPQGIIVIEIRPDASFAPEILPQDIITHADGTRILALDDLKEVLSKYDIGDTIEVTVYRRTESGGSEEFKAQVVLAAPEE